MTTQEKYHAMLLELKNRGIVKTQKELAKLLNMQEASLSLAAHGKTSSINLLNRINDAAGSIFNLAWIYSGEGEMLAEKQQQTTFGYTNINGDNNNLGSGTQTITTAGDSEEVKKLRKRVRELELENAKLQGMIEILKNR